MEDYTYKRLTSATTIYSLFEILRELLGQIDTNLKANKYEKNYLIMQIDNFIQGNYQKNIALKDIADAVHVSPAYVSRLYRNKCGVTVTDAIIRTRMEQSKKLLRQTSYKIYEIAELVGVEDPAYFTNVFTKYVGCNPSEYRNQK